MNQEHYAVVRLNKVCDFCNSPHIKWEYPAISAQVHDYGNIKTASIGGWAACEDCAELIESKDKEGLLNNTIASFMDYSPFPLPSYAIDSLKRFMREVHGVFWLCKFGERKQA